MNRVKYTDRLSIFVLRLVTRRRVTLFTKKSAKFFSSSLPPFIAVTWL